MKAVALAAALAALIPALAHAETPNGDRGATPMAMPSDSRLVRFNYDPNNTYTILTRPMSVTNLQLEPGEEVETFAIGDTVQWIVSDAPGHVFIKPGKEGLVTSGTLVTNQRTYQITLRSSPTDGMFYQQVTWHNPALFAVRKEQRRVQSHEMQLAQREQAVMQEEGRLERSTASQGGVDVQNLNFDYDISGNARFKPTQVFDDGRFTWVRMPDHQEMPAFFMLNEDGDAELLNTTMRDDYVVIHRLVPGLLLKLGDREVEVRDRSQCSGWFNSCGGRSNNRRSNSPDDDSFWKRYQ